LPVGDKERENKITDDFKRGMKIGWYFTFHCSHNRF